ncbi:SusE domain-containing protein [Flavobacterium sp. RHBU_3]|uniref:SusE domain-containing protein n=1 Tax=Flavobacterium sp. RHBU_3 TaxID=3391184 RepID=UPI003984DE78
MKTLRNSIIAICAIFAVSCNVDDVENRPVVQANGDITLSAPEDGNVYVLSPDQMNNLAERFVWTAGDFGDGIIPNYDIQIDYSGDNFDTPVIVASTNNTTQVAISQNVLNNALLSLGATPFESATLQVRIRGYVDSIEMYSNSVEIYVTPYTTETPRLWVPGGYQAASGYGADWTPADAPQLLATGYGDTHFEGYVYFASVSEFKFTSQADWNGTNYGAGSAANTLDAAGGNLTPPAAGYYKVAANTDPATLSYTLTPASWGIIGSATPTGWDSDTDMVYDPATKKWTVTIALTGGQEVKFRANDAWDLNYGDDGADASLNEGGANIAVAATGTYLVTLDLSSPRAYTYSLQLQ